MLRNTESLPVLAFAVVKIGGPNKEVETSAAHKLKNGQHSKLNGANALRKTFRRSLTMKKFEKSENNGGEDVKSTPQMLLPSRKA